MTFTAIVFDEPDLQFGNGQKHIDPRQGLREFGPLQAHAGAVVTVGVLGSSETCEAFANYIVEAQKGVEGNHKGLPNLNPDFPGLGNANPFACRFVVPDTGRRTLSNRQLRSVKTAASVKEAVHILLDVTVRSDRYPFQHQGSRSSTFVIL